MGLVGVGGGVAATVYTLKSSNKNPGPSAASASAAAIVLNTSLPRSAVAQSAAAPAPSEGYVDADEVARSGAGAANALAMRGPGGKRVTRAGATEAPAAAAETPATPVTPGKNQAGGPIDPTLPGWLEAAAQSKTKSDKPAAVAKAITPKETAKSSGTPFNRDAAMAVLGIAASQAASCKRPGGPTGNGKALITFDSDGQVVIANIVGDEIAGTPVARCVASIFQRIRVAPFSGDRATVSKAFTIPP